MPINKKTGKSPKSSTRAKASVSNKAKPKKRVRRKGENSRRNATKKKTKLKSAIIVLLLSLCLVSFSMYLFVLDQRVTQRFEGRIWQLPAHVYARPLEIFVGKSISVKQLKFELAYLNYQAVDVLPQRAAQYRHRKNTFEIKTRHFTFWDGDEPAHSIRMVIENDRVTQLTDLYTAESKALVRFDAGYLTGIFPAHSQDRVLLRLDDVPDMFIKMLLLTEDRRFFTHWGVDPQAITRAMVANLSAGRIVQGGSTLTQQLVKNLFLTQEKKLIRKINEAFMSLILEFRFDKKLILETYINEIYLGQDGRRAIHGFGLASDFYFDKELKELTIDEMAILIAMVKGASFYNPKRNPDNAKQRRNLVLNTMKISGLITAQQEKKLSDKAVNTVKHAKTGLFPAFIDVVKLQLQQDYHADDLSSEGLRVFTTLDPYIQFQTEQAIKNTLPKLTNSKKLQAAAVVVSPLSGDVLAVVGDRNPSFKGFNRALNAQRPIGSLIKPVIYLSALESGMGYTLATMLDDSALSVKQAGQPDWQPQNFDKKFRGNVTLHESLVNSYNIPAIRTALDVGLGNVINTLSALGVEQQINEYPSLALGAINMSPMQVAKIYQSLSATGFQSPLRSVHAVLDKHKQPLERYSLEIESQVNAESVALINSVLIDVTKYGTAKQLSNNLTIQVAGKTGTSDDLRDSWFAGFSADIVAVVWTGYDDNRPASLTGSSGAMQIWQNMMSEIAYQPYQLSEQWYMTAPVDNQRKKQPHLSKHWIDRKNGLLTEKSCENAVELLFIAGTQPEQRSDCLEGKKSNWFLNLFD